jgi:S1-C subfamily serine protease
MNKWYFLSAAALLMCGLTGTLNAQEAPAETPDTKVIIIEEKVDHMGNKTVTKTIREGNFTDEEIEQLIASDSGEMAHTARNKGYLGVMIENAANGVRITEVVEDSPAAGAGLLAGDILTRVGDTETPDIEMLVNAVGSHAPGKQVTIHFLRNGAEQNTTATLGEREEMEITYLIETDMDELKEREHEKAMKEYEKAMQHHEKMMEHDEMMKDHGSDKPRFGVYLDDVEYGPGVRVTHVVEGSVAESAGMREGDVITSFNNRDVNSSEDLIKAVKSAPAHEKVKVTYLRAGKKMKEKVTFQM